MSFTFSASGPVQQVTETLAAQAEQYAADGIEHVRDFLANLAGHLDQGHGASLSASGHIDAGQVTLSANGSSLAAPSGESTPQEPAAPVS
jgi:hypothetical protein